MEGDIRKVLVILGSPRKKGNSAALALRAAEGARAGGAQIEIVDLARLDIRPCTACDMCTKGTGEFCNIRDDMQAIYPKLVGADALLLASPVYWFTYSGQLKVFIDRWYGAWNTQPKFLKGKPVGIILAYGDEDVDKSGVFNAIHTFESMFSFLGAPIAGIVHGSLSDPGDAEKDVRLMQAAYELGKKLA